MIAAALACALAAYGLLFACAWSTLKRVDQPVNSVTILEHNLAVLTFWGSVALAVAAVILLLVEAVR